MKVFFAVLFALLIAVAMGSKESKLAKVCVGAKEKPAPGGWLKLKEKQIKASSAIQKDAQTVGNGAAGQLNCTLQSFKVKKACSQVVSQSTNYQYAALGKFLCDNKKREISFNNTFSSP